MASQQQPGEYVSYAPLKAWILEQEAYEHRLGRPAPLTEEQRLAMAVLVPPPATIPTQLTADAQDTDWVSLLMRYIQAQKSEPTPPVFKDEPIQSSSSISTLWRCRCRLPREAPDLWFPDVNEQHPQDSIFPRKKDAKQHAARCAVEWLMANHYMPSDGVAVTFPIHDRLFAIGANNSKTSGVSTGGNVSNCPDSKTVRLQSTTKVDRQLSQPAKRLKTESTTDEGIQQQQRLGLQHLIEFQEPTQKQTTTPLRVRSMASYRANVGAGGTSSSQTVSAAVDNSPITTSDQNNNSSAKSSKNSMFPHPRGDDSDYEDVSNVQRLDNLCKVLKLGSPAYELTASSDGIGGLFSGQIGFPSLNTKGGRGSTTVLPDGVGVVHGVYTRKAAKEKIAQSVLQHLQENVLKSTTVL